MWQSTSELGSMTSECLPKKTNHRNTSPFLTVRFVADGHQTFTICQSKTFDSDITMQHRRLETLSQLLLSICSARSIDIAQRCLTIYWWNRSSDGWSWAWVVRQVEAVETDVEWAFMTHVFTRPRRIARMHTPNMRPFREELVFPTDRGSGMRIVLRCYFCSTLIWKPALDGIPRLVNALSLHSCGRSRLYRPRLGYSRTTQKRARCLPTVVQNLTFSVACLSTLTIFWVAVETMG